MEKIDREEFLKLFKTLPLNLKNALFAEETGSNIEKICRRNDIDDKFSDLLNLTGQVLIGLLPVEELEKILVRDLELSMEKSKKVAREIIRFVFFPVKNDLTDLYGIGSPSEKIFEKESASSSAPVQSDTYRESLD